MHLINIGLTLYLIDQEVACVGREEVELQITKLLLVVPDGFFVELDPVLPLDLDVVDDPHVVSVGA